MWPWHSLADHWLTKAADLRRYGAEEAACTLEACAQELQERAEDWIAEPLTLEEASEESGYSKDHLGRLLSDGVIPNTGEPYGPRIRRRDLPRKPGHRAEHRTSSLDQPVSSRTQVARSVVNSD